MNYLIYNLPSLICAIGAVLLAVYGKPGWGWFLACALILSVSPKSSK